MGMEDAAKIKTPELEKQRAARDQGSQKIGEFLEWCAEQGWGLMYYPTLREAYPDRYEDDDPKGDETCHEPLLVSKTMEQLLADFFEIDLKKVEEERRALLDAINDKTTSRRTSNTEPNEAALPRTEPG